VVAIATTSYDVRRAGGLVAYRRGVFKVLGALFVLIMIAAGAGLALKGKDVVSAFGGRLTDPQDPEGDEHGKKVPQRKICASLGPAQRRDLVGVATPVKLTQVEGALSPSTCRWTTQEGRATTTFVDIVVAPADAWALQARDRLMLTSIDPERQAQLLALLEKPEVTAEDGCRFARALFEAGGAPGGAERTVAPTTRTGSTPAMLAESCVDGRYHAVLATAPRLRLDRALERRVAGALRHVERAI
jgi:hypothetical protein